MVGQLAGRSVSQVAEESVGPLLVLFAAEGGGGGTQGEVGKEMKRSAQISRRDKTWKDEDPRVRACVSHSMVTAHILTNRNTCSKKLLPIRSQVLLR